MISLIKLEVIKIINSNIWLLSFMLCFILLLGSAVNSDLNHHFLAESKITDNKELIWHIENGQDCKLSDLILHSNKHSQEHLVFQNQYLLQLIQNEEASQYSKVRYEYSKKLLDNGFIQAFDTYSEAPALNRLYNRLSTQGYYPYFIVALILSSYLMSSTAQSKSRKIYKILPTSSIDNYLSKLIVSALLSIVICTCAILIIFFIESTIISILLTISAISVLSLFIDDTYMLIAVPITALLILNSLQAITLNELNNWLLKHRLLLLASCLLFIFVRTCYSTIFKD